MTLKRARTRLLVVWNALSMLAAIHKRDRNLAQIIGNAWRIAKTEGIDGVKSRVILLARLAHQPARSALTYQQWLEQFDPLLNTTHMHAARRHLATLSLPDLLILAIVSRDDVATFGRVIASWSESIHEGWHAAIVASNDLSDSELDTIRALGAPHPRISLLRTPDEINAIRSRFKYTLLCFGGVLLNRLSTYMFVEAAVRTGAEIVYADNDRIDGTGRRIDPAFKPQFSPEYVARYNYIGDCFLVCHSAPFTSQEASSLFQLTLQEYDRFVAQLVLHRRVEHIPFVLSHVLATRARSRHDLPVFGNEGPGVAIIIPTRDGLDYLKPCIESLLGKTSYKLDLVEIIVVDNNSRKPETLSYLNEISARSNIRVVKYPFPFNFAAINNFGSRQTGKDILVFLNNDTLVYDPDWLSKLVWYAKQPDIGVVGAKLLFPDGTIQHGGCAAGANAGTVGHLLTHANPGDVAGSDHTREMTLFTGACIALRRDVFAQVGGFDPILKITWNDMKLCLDCLSAGLRNVYVSDPLFYHDESKTRGHDKSAEHMTRYFSEANYTRGEYRDYFYDDPSYNPNLSLDNRERFAVPPRVRRPWPRAQDQPRRILVLSMVYQVGFGVPLVIQQQVRKLQELGYEIVIGGPKAEREVALPGCERVIMHSPQEAAAYAFETDVSLIISHTPPYFEIPVFIGAHIPVLAYDYGEPSPQFFPEPTRSYLIDVANKKRSAEALTTVIATISQAVKDETLNNDAIVVGLANSHLPAWSEALRPRRDSVRQRLGWVDRFVVLTVCRFHQNERAYKGLDKIAVILREFPYLHPAQSEKIVWTLAGAGTPSDVEQAEALGFTVHPNVSEEELIDLYAAADCYMGFSRWEGYNLGISQALAMGLPTIASDIPAHREFPIVTSDSILAVSNWLADTVRAQRAGKHDRRAIVYDWDEKTARFGEIVEQLLQHSGTQKPRLGASVWFQNEVASRSVAGG